MLSQAFVIYIENKHHKKTISLSLYLGRLGTCSTEGYTTKIFSKVIYTKQISFIIACICTKHVTLAIHGVEKVLLNHDHWLWAHPAVDLVMCYNSNVTS